MRNIRCTHYSDCLNAAIDMNLTGWQCEGCRRIREVGPIDPAELERAALLLIAIFFPEAYDRIREQHLQQTS